MRAVTKKPLAFLLGIGILLCAADGFVTWFRPASLSENSHRTSSTPTDARLYGRQEFDRDFDGSRLLSSQKQQQQQLVSMNASNEEEFSAKPSHTSTAVREMASFLCFRLLETVVTELTRDDNNDDDDKRTKPNLDAEAIERLTRALQMGQNNEPGSDDYDSAASESLEADSLPLKASSEDETKITPGLPKLAVGEEPEDEASIPPPELVTEQEPALPMPIEGLQASPLSFSAAPLPEDPDAVRPSFLEGDSTLEMEEFHDDEPEIYPDGSIPFPQTDTPTYAVSSLEVVASNVVPLRPFSIPQKEKPSSITDARVIANEMDVEQTPTINDDGWEEQQKSEELVRRRLLQRRLEMDVKTRMVDSAELDAAIVEGSATSEGDLEEQQKFEELVRRKLLQRRLEMDTARKMDDDDLQIDAATIEKLATAEDGWKEQHQQSEELLRRNLLQRRLEMDAETKNLDHEEMDAAIPTESATTEGNSEKQNNSDELMRRKLLQRRLEMDAAIQMKAVEEVDVAIPTAEFVGIEESATAEDCFEEQKKSEELVRRKLLERRLEMSVPEMMTDNAALDVLEKIATDTTSGDESEPALTSEHQKSEELVRRKLLERRLKTNVTITKMEGTASGENKETAAFAIARQQSEELVRRTLLQKRLEIAASGLSKPSSRNNQPDSVGVPEQVSPSKEETNDSKESAAFAEARKKSEELVRRTLLQRRLDIAASNLSKPSFQPSSQNNESDLVGGMETNAISEQVHPSVEEPNEHKETAAFEAARQKAEELARRRLLRNRLESNKAAVMEAARTTVKQPTESTRIKTPRMEPTENGSSNMDFNAMGRYVEQRKSEELFRRRLLKKQLEFIASQKEIKIMENDDALSKTKSTAVESSELENRVISENKQRKKAEEMFRRRLLAKRLEIDAKNTRRKKMNGENIATTTEVVQKERERLRKMGSSETISPATKAFSENEEKREAQELFQGSLLDKKSAIDSRKRTEKVNGENTANDESTQRIYSTNKFEYATMAIEIIQKEMELVQEKGSSKALFGNQEQKKAEELFRRHLLAKKLEYDSKSSKTEVSGKNTELPQKIYSTNKFEFATMAIEIIQKERGLVQEKCSPETTPVALKSSESRPVSENQKVTAEEADYASPKSDSARNDGFVDYIEVDKALSLGEDSVAKDRFIASLEIDKASSQGNDSVANGRFVASVEVDDASESDGEIFKSGVTGEASMNDDKEENNKVVPQASVIDLNSPSMLSVPDRTSPTCSIPDEIVRPEFRMSNSIRDEWVSSLPTITQERYAREARKSHSFPAREFNPTEWSVNNHFQTIAGTLFRKESMYSRGFFFDMGTFLDLLGVVDGSAIADETKKPLEEFEWDERFRVESSDGDFFIVDWSHANGKKNDGENPVCLICHGLESCSESDIVQEIAIACNDMNIDAACLNFRGCHDGGEECNLTTRAYHLGFTDDLMQQIEEIHSKNPNRRIYLSGFSLGAGVVTKLLAELGPKAYDYNICGAATNAVPFDCGQNYKALNEPGFTKWVYGDRLLASMKRRLGRICEQGVFPFDKSELEKCQTIMDVENIAIAPFNDFDDALDYYDKVKTIDKLHKVCVPQFVIQARDDPFFVGLETVASDESIPLRVHYTDHGGHCGYIFHQREPDEKGAKTSWMPRQLARFFSHIEKENGNRSDEANLATIAMPEREKAKITIV